MSGILGPTNIHGSMLGYLVTTSAMGTDETITPGTIGPTSSHESVSGQVVAIGTKWGNYAWE